MSEWLEDEAVHDRELPTAWTTRDGREVRIADMKDSHLLNTIAFLRRRNRAAVRRRALRDALRAGSYASTAPDGAADAALEHASSALRGDFDDRILEEEMPVFTALLDEVYHRGLMA